MVTSWRCTIGYLALPIIVNAFQHHHFRPGVTSSISLPQGHVHHWSSLKQEQVQPRSCPSSLSVANLRDADFAEMMVGGIRYEMVPLPDSMMDTTLFVGNLNEFVHVGRLIVLICLVQSWKYTGKDYSPKNKMMHWRRSFFSLHFRTMTCHNCFNPSRICNLSQHVSRVDQIWRVYIMALYHSKQLKRKRYVDKCLVFYLKQLIKLSLFDPTNYFGTMLFCLSFIAGCYIEIQWMQMERTSYQG